MRSVLSGIVLSVVAVWLAWFAGWLWRVELERRAATCMARFGLAPAREGVGACIVAGGAFEGTPIVIEWKRGFLGVRVCARVGTGTPWRRVPDGEDVEEWVLAQLLPARPE